MLLCVCESVKENGHIFCYQMMAGILAEAAMLCRETVPF
jgi:hypothetical protein